MSSLVCPAPGSSRAVRWSDVILPKEHGSWSLAVEPLTLGLLAAPSTAGAWLATAAVAGFLARRPLKLALRETRPDRRRAARLATVALSVLAAGGLTLSLAAAGPTLLLWLLAPALGGAVFLYFDLQNEGREEFAEIAGSGAFACVAGAMAASAGWAPWAAGGLLFAMCARSIPTVMFVRAYIRAGKTGRNRPLPPLVAAGGAVAGAIALTTLGIAPWFLAVALFVLWLHAAIHLAWPAPRLRARTIGFQELALGLIYVVGVALTWPA